MLKSVVFYNHYGNGDVFESREFVRDYMQKIQANDYYYAHGKNPRILADMPELQFTEVTEAMHGMSAVVLIEPDVLGINTWIGRNGKYVLPGIGCVVEYLCWMHGDISKALGISPPSRDMMEYIPNIDYSYYDTKSIDEFCEKHQERKVLISNGPAQSNQAKNFDFTPAIKMVSITFPDIAFILSSPADIDEDNVFFTSDITKTNDGFDLNEISYLSLFCDTHVGRNSGPHVFAQVLDNWRDPHKVTLSFTYRKEASHFVWQLPTKMKKLWSESTDVGGVYQAIHGAITLERNK